MRNTSQRLDELTEKVEGLLRREAGRKVRPARIVRRTRLVESEYHIQQNALAQLAALQRMAETASEIGLNLLRMNRDEMARGGRHD